MASSWTRISISGPFCSFFSIPARGFLGRKKSPSSCWFLRDTNADPSYWSYWRVCTIFFKKILFSDTGLLSPTPDLNDPNFHEVCGNLQGTFVATSEGLVFWSWGRYPGKKRYQNKRTWVNILATFHQNHCTLWFWKTKSIKVTIWISFQVLLRLVRKRFAEVSPVYMLYIYLCIYIYIVYIYIYCFFGIGPYIELLAYKTCMKFSMAGRCFRQLMDGWEGRGSSVGSEVVKWVAPVLKDVFAGKSQGEM